MNPTEFPICSRDHAPQPFFYVFAGVVAIGIIFIYVYKNRRKTVDYLDYVQTRMV